MIPILNNPNTMPVSTSQSAMEGWRDTDINVESLWFIPQRAKGGKRENNYHGNFVPQIPNQLISRYTSPNDLVMELFSGSGTALFECETLNRQYIGYDINSEMIDYVRKKMENTKIVYSLLECNVTDTETFDILTEQSLSRIGKTKVDFLIAHPPYLDIIKFTDKPGDLSAISDEKQFLESLQIAFSNAWKYLKVGGYFALVMGDLYRNSEILPLGFDTMAMVKSNFDCKLKGIIVKNISGNRGKLGQNDIWHYRALKSDYYIFKHEYIFVFKKMN
ncbi:MAG: DNA adenine methylase [Paludibacteraceae bacterium]|nr:DNA adenine methylase [Paludibacteraceae bacterium]